MQSDSPPQRWGLNNAVTVPLVEELANLLRYHDGALQEYLAWLEARFEAIEPGLLAFLPEPDRFARLKEEADKSIDQFPDPSRRPALFGLPIGVKDIFHVSGFVTHAGSSLPVEVLNGEEATCVTGLRQAGALILGKTVTTEFAYFAPGPTRNPHNPEHTPGGSSSGSAAAVAAGLVPLALGTQTIGSINRPASFCGVVGFKPTYARISTQGVIPLSPTLDHIGYFTFDAGSAAWVAPLLLDGWRRIDPGERSLRLALPIGPYLEEADDISLERLEQDAGILRAAGHEVIELPVMDDFDAIVERHNMILAADATHVHQSWYGSFSEKYHPKTADLIRRGDLISPESYQKGLHEKARLRTTLEDVMDKNEIDAWISPSAPGPAPQGLESTGDPVMNLPWTQSGMPSLTLPSGKTDEGLPLGLQVTARAGQDEELLLWASQLERSLSFEPMHGLDEFLGTQRQDDQVFERGKSTGQR
jgi:Asp-tRNA(Asn)/Glu-tRNA(Gln) amidotransferase A subunit family amidase